MRPANLPRLATILASLVIIVAPAAGFGYMTGQTSETVAPGGTASFTVYIAADGPVTASASGPAGWPVAVSPDEVDADTTAGARYVKTGDGYTRVVPVETTVSVPDTTSSGDHAVTVSFTQEASGDGDSSTALTVSQTQDVTFTVTVKDGYTPPSSGSSSGTSGGSGGGGSGGGSGGGGAGGGLFQQARDILGGGDKTQEETGGQTGGQEDEEQGTDRKLIPSGNKTGGTQENATQEREPSGGTRASGLLTGVPNSLVLAFELLWVAVVAYLLLRRR